MDNIYSLTNKFKKNLDQEETIINLKEEYKNISYNKELIKMINEYKINNNIQLRNKIIENEEYRKIQKLEGDLNYIILNINHELKKITRGDLDEDN